MDITAEAIKANPQKSDRAIAKEIGSSPTTVGKARAQVSTDGHLDERVGRDGKSYSAGLPITDDPDEDDLASELELEVYLAALALVLSWEMDDPRDAWKHTGGPRPEVSECPAPARPPYRTSQASVDAFLYVARNHDAAYLARWLENHRQDIAFLTKLWEAKNGIS